MFGRNTIEATPTPELTQEELDALVLAAHERIELREDGEYLDGYKLAPDNDEVWDPKVIKGTITRIFPVQVEGGFWTLGGTVEHIEFPSRLTNSFIRNSNIRCIAQGHLPLYTTWDEVDLSGLRAPRESLSTRFLGRLGLRSSK